jgi:hypothetical protein
VVDGESLVRWSLSEMLAAAGYQVVEAQNGHEARVALADEQHRIDVMLVDLNLPDTDGPVLVPRSTPGMPCPCHAWQACAGPVSIEPLGHALTSQHRGIIRRTAEESALAGEDRRVRREFYRADRHQTCTCSCRGRIRAATNQRDAPTIAHHDHAGSRLRCNMRCLILTLARSAKQTLSD